jgi:hypothetical protein
MWNRKARAVPRRTALFPADRIILALKSDSEI